MSDSKNTEVVDPHAIPADAAHIREHVKLYVVIGVTLLFFTGLTVLLSYVHFGSESANIAIGMLVASIKAAMVAAIFMHLKEERKTIYQFMTVTVIFALVLFLLTFLAFSDHIKM